MSKIDLNFHKTVTLKSGKQVVLRYPQPKDVDSLLLFANTIVEEEPYVSLCQKLTYEEELDYLSNIIKKVRKGEEIHLAAYDKDRYLGKVDITNTKLPRQEHIGRLGISLAKEVREQGLGKILLEEALSQAKEMLGLKMIILDCFKPNIIAQKLYKSFGFKEYGLLPQGIRYKGKYIDRILMYKKLT